MLIETLVNFLVCLLIGLLCLYSIFDMVNFFSMILFSCEHHYLMWPTIGSVLCTHVLWYGGHFISKTNAGYSH